MEKESLVIGASKSTCSLVQLEAFTKTATKQSI